MTGDETSNQGRTVLRRRSFAPAVLDRLLAAGVNGIISDEDAILAAVLATRSEPSS